MSKAVSLSTVLKDDGSYEWGMTEAYKGLRDNFLYFLILDGGLFEANSEGSCPEVRE